MSFEKFFNTAGPVNPVLHYCLPPLERFDLNEVLRLIIQTRDYMDKSNADEGHLLIFDRATTKPWAEKIFTQTAGDIVVWGL